MRICEQSDFVGGSSGAGSLQNAAGSSRGGRDRIQRGAVDCIITAEPGRATVLIPTG